LRRRLRGGLEMGGPKKGLDNRGVAGATSGDGTRNRASTRGAAVKDQSERQSERNVIPAQMAWHGYLPARSPEILRRCGRLRDEFGLRTRTTTIYGFVGS